MNVVHLKTTISIMAPLPLSIETPYETLETLEVKNNEELFAKIDGDLWRNQCQIWKQTICNNKKKG